MDDLQRILATISGSQTQSQAAAQRQQRNRRIISCIECRRLKRKCSRTQPCIQCQKLLKECVFPPGVLPLDQQQQHDVRPSPSGSSSRGEKKAVSGGGSSSRPPLRDISLQIGRLSITERIGGLERKATVPLFEDMLRLYREKSGEPYEEDYDQMSLAPPVIAWFKPKPILPLTQLLCGIPLPAAVGEGDESGTGIFLTLAQQLALVDQFLLAVRPVCAVVSRHDLGFMADLSEGSPAMDGGRPTPGSGSVVDSSLAPTEAQDALRWAVLFAAAVSLPLLESQRLVGLPKDLLVRKLRASAERALCRVGVLDTSPAAIHPDLDADPDADLHPFQALIVYLTPQLLADVSRSHSVLLAAATRVFMLTGLHRDGDDAEDADGFASNDGWDEAHEAGSHQKEVRKQIQRLRASKRRRRQTKRHLWQHLLFLNIRATEAVGPEQSIIDDPGAPMPALDFQLAEATPGGEAEDRSEGPDDAALVALVRYEGYAIHRLIFSERERVKNGTNTFDGAVALIDAARARVKRGLLDGLQAARHDTASVYPPLRKYAALVGQLLVARAEGMVLQNQQYREWASSISARQWRDRIIAANLDVLEAGVALETDPALAPWAWYSGAYHQYHAVLFPMGQVMAVGPEDLGTPVVDRIMDMVGHVFGPDSSPATQENPRRRVAAILTAVKESLTSYLLAQGMRVPVVPEPMPMSIGGSGQPPPSASALLQPGQKPAAKGHDYNAVDTGGSYVCSDASLSDGITGEASAAQLESLLNFTDHPITASEIAASTLAHDLSPHAREDPEINVPGSLTTGEVIPSLFHPAIDEQGGQFLPLAGDADTDSWWRWPPAEVQVQLYAADLLGDLDGADFDDFDAT